MVALQELYRRECRRRDPTQVAHELCEAIESLVHISRLEGVLGATDVVLRYVDARTLTALDATNKGLRPFITDLVIRSAVLARFPLLQAQLALIPSDADFKKLYARHLALEVKARDLALEADAARQRGVWSYDRRSTTTPGDYAYFCRVETNEGPSFAYALHPVTDDNDAVSFCYAGRVNGRASRSCCFRTHDALDASILRRLRSWIQAEEDLDDPLGVLVTCMRTSTTEQAIIFDTNDLDDSCWDRDSRHHVFPYEAKELEIKPDLNRFFRSDPHRDFCQWGEVHGQIRFVCPSALRANNSDEEPQLDDSYLLFTMRWSSWGERSPNFRDFPLDEETALLLLENAMDFAY